MARSLPSAHGKFALLLLLFCTASTVISGGQAAGDVVSHSFPAFDATTTDRLWVVTNSSLVTPASLVFESIVSPKFNASEGFMLVPQRVDIWRATDDLEASFGTSFTVVSGAAPVSFVILKDTLPVFNQPSGLRGAANYTMSAGGPVPTNATGSLAFVEVDAVRSYEPTAGLNVTVTPRAGARSITAWVEYHAAGVHRLSVFVAEAGEARPANALVNTSLGVGGHWTTETAFVGFFAGTIRDIIVGVRDWNLTADRFPVTGEGVAVGTSWLVMLLAVLGSVAATTAI